MEYVKQVRLAKAREEMLATQGAKSVTSIAMEWGFNHLGHFARDYRARFGELPSQTLRSHRGL